MTSATDLTRRPTRASRRSSLLPCVACLAFTSIAHAQTASPEDIASARAVGTEGVRLADSDDCAAAMPKLEAAEKLYHAPTTLGRLGECQVKLGRLVAGTESLNRVVRETLPPNAPAAFVGAQHRAAQILATAQMRIGKLRIHVDGAPIDQVSVTVDGANVPAALFNGERPTDPGAHEVKAGAPGYKTATAAVQLRDGGDSTVSLTLEPESTPIATPAESGMSAPATSSPSSATNGPPPPRAPSPNRAPAFIALGIGGVGVALGSVFGILALSTKSSLDNACTSKICPGSSQSDIDALSTRATISTIGFAVGIVGVGIGAVLIATSLGGDARPAAAAPLRVWPWVGAGTAGIGGVFE